MNRTLILGLITGGVAIVLTACGGGGGSASSTSGSSSSSEGTSVGTAGVNIGRATEHIAATDQLKFSPASQNVHVGDVVAWTNSGTVAHTVTFDSNPSLTDPTLNPSATWEVKFTQPGTYQYRCTIHPGMTGTIVVS